MLLTNPHTLAGFGVIFGAANRPVPTVRIKLTRLPKPDHRPADSHRLDSAIAVKFDARATLRPTLLNRRTFLASLHQPRVDRRAGIGLNKLRNQPNSTTRDPRLFEASLGVLGAKTHAPRRPRHIIFGQLLDHFFNRSEEHTSELQS